MAAKPIPLTAPTQTVETRVGNLSFELGLPTEDTVTKLFDSLDFQRACQAYIWALPLVGFATFRRFFYQTLAAGDGDIVSLQTYREKLGWLTPNATTPYIVSYINLARTGALVIDLPAGPNGSIVSDAWEHSVTDMGQTGPDKGAGGKYLILGPGQGEFQNAAGYLVFPSTTNNISLGFRALDPDPVKATKAEIPDACWKNLSSGTAPRTCLLGTAGGHHRQRTGAGTRPHHDGHTQAAGH